MLERIFGGLDCLAAGYIVQQAVQLNHLHDVRFTTLIDDGRFDVNLRGPWPNKSGYDTTLLLHAIEQRNRILIQDLLQRGADVTARDDENMGVIDLLLSSNKMDVTLFTVPIWEVLKPHSPPRIIRASTLFKFEHEWQYKEYPRDCQVLIDLVADCDIVD